MTTILSDAVHDSPSQWMANSFHTLSSDEKLLYEKLQSQFDSPYELLWVHGPAGIGKTSITHSLAQKLIRGPITSAFIPSANHLGSSFFFSRENGITDYRKLFVTLAHRLSESSQVLAPHIQSALEGTPRILCQSLKEQCENLIVQPVRAWASSATAQQDIFIFIDGLEQCDGGETTQTEIIRIIHQIFSSLTIDYVRWRWVISSRPEAWIHSTFLSLYSPQAIVVPISPANRKETEDYILAAVVDRRIRENGSINSLTSLSNQISFRAMNNLWWHSNGYFAFLASLITYINSSSTNVAQRIREVTTHVECASFKHNYNNMFSQLDALYHDILSRVSLLSQATTRRVLGAICLIQPSNSDGTIPLATTVAELLGLSFQELYDSLYPLHSVVNSPVQCPDGSFTNPELKFHHKSFDAFLRNRSRSHDWSIDLAVAHADLAECCLKYIKAGSGQNTNQAVLAYAVQRWFVHCWRTDTGTDGSVDAAFTILPELYDMDFKKLPETVDRYFVEWLLRVQELTMSEYLVLNPGPDYAPEEPVPWSYYSQRSLWSQPPSYSQARTSTSRHGYRSRTRKLPPRPTYVLGIEPEKQVLLVPTFEEKDFRREDVNFNVIGPREKCWDLIRSFRVTAISNELHEELYDGGISAVDVGLQNVLYAESQPGRDMTLEQPGGIVSGSDYDEFVARSLAWAEENGGTEYDQLVAQSLAWEEENGELFGSEHNEPLERHTNQNDDGLQNPTSISNFSGLMESVGHVGEGVEEQRDAESEDDLYYDGGGCALGSEYPLANGDRGHTSANHECTNTAPSIPESLQHADSTDEKQECTGKADVDEDSDGYSEIIVVRSGGESRQGNDPKDSEEETFEVIEWSDVQDD